MTTLMTAPYQNVLWRPLAVHTQASGSENPKYNVAPTGRSDVRFQEVRSRFIHPTRAAWELPEVDVAVQGRRRDRWTSVDLL